MASRRFKRKYQAGGVLPSFQGAQVLSRPIRIQQQVQPREFDPSSTFQAVNTRQNSFRNALSQAQLNRSERQDAWRRELADRKRLEDRSVRLRAKMQSGLDQLTKLDMNIPEQFRMATDMRNNIDRINEESTAILIDETLTPQERAARLQEKYLETQRIFGDQEYIKFLQNNELAGRVYDGISKEAANGKTLIDFQSANENIEAARRFQNGEIGRDDFFTSMKRFTLDPKEVSKKEAIMDEYLENSLDPDKAITSWEQYKADDQFFVMQELFQVPSLDDQVDAYVGAFMNDENWKKVQEAQGRFVGDDGFFDEDVFRQHVTRKIEALRGSLEDEGKEMVVGFKGQKKTVPRRSSGSGGGRMTESQRRNQLIRQGLNEAGYTINDPSIVAQIDSASDAIDILETPDEELTADDIRYKRVLERALTNRNANNTPTSSTQTTTTTTDQPLTVQQPLPNINPNDLIRQGTTARAPLVTNPAQIQTSPSGQQVTPSRQPSSKVKKYYPGNN